MTTMFLDDIIIYPIKSLAGVRLKKSKVEARGLKYDRRWMLVDEQNRFITARQHHNLLLFELKITDNNFIIKDRSSGDVLEIPVIHNSGKELKVKIWDDEVTAIEGDKNWSKWLSDHTGLTCDLVYMPDTSKRPIKQKWAQNNEIVSFADGYPILIAGSSSLDDLNKKLDHSISMDRFRPNLVFAGGNPYEELKWKKFKIGDQLFQGLKPCERCVVTTLDPKTAQKGKEPLRTLARQKINDKIVFGQHVAVIDTGIINTGSQIDIISYKDSPYDPL